MHARGLLMVPKHPWEHRNRHPPQHASSSRMHHPCHSTMCWRRRGMHSQRVSLRRVVVVVLVQVVMLMPVPEGHCVDIRVKVLISSQSRVLISSQSRRVGLGYRLFLVVNGGWTARDFDALLGALPAVPTAVKRNQGVLGEGCLADWALLCRRAINLQPLVDARPAVEVAAEGNHRIHGKVQADIAFEAPTGRHRL
ncbi:E3 ubiquitin-protein ligase RMA3-like [Iris pallida]|uniref:E3 ubiquitin-protein ligase RMA3-like n=1 Tax=Iris pallida TaxID=29817 RepID=A0AAX6I086_IRIPA|nr:E3 ubiquitin-protein ligase RMA3-like [Iris pallida]